MVGEQTGAWAASLASEPYDRTVTQTAAGVGLVGR